MTHTHTFSNLNPSVFDRPLVCKKCLVPAPVLSSSESRNGLDLCCDSNVVSLKCLYENQHFSCTVKALLTVNEAQLSCTKHPSQICYSSRFAGGRRLCGTNAQVLLVGVTALPVGPTTQTGSKITKPVAVSILAFLYRFYRGECFMCDT